MWNAKLDIPDTSQPNNDTIDVSVTYTDEDTGRVFTKIYNLHAALFPSVQSVEDFVRKNVVDLDSFEPLREAVILAKDLVVITATGVKSLDEKQLPLDPDATLESAVAEIKKAGAGVGVGIVAVP